MKTRTNLLQAAATDLPPLLAPLCLTSQPHHTSSPPPPDINFPSNRHLGAGHEDPHQPAAATDHPVLLPPLCLPSHPHHQALIYTPCHTLNPRLTGIWTRDMKTRTNLQQPQITKIIKTLEGRKLIKAVKSVNNKSRKLYMLYELEPSREVTGGAWYTDAEFDAEFISALRQLCLTHIVKLGGDTLEGVVEAVRRAGSGGREDLRMEDFRQVISTLVFDRELDVFISTGSGKDSRFPVGAEVYRPSRSRAPESSAFTNIPCGVCP
ncbi:unnamed protein product, partial [Closterium sp. Naga37s-1]